LIKIIDYGVGNLRSVQKALETLGYEVEITNNPVKLKEAGGLILPGVGAFGDAMLNLQQSGLLEVIQESIDQGKPFLGICLGLQLLLSESDESDIVTKGLGLFPGKVEKLPPTLKVPHMGWNQLYFPQENPLFANIAEGSFVYFVHSYYVKPNDKETIIATTPYGLNVPAALARDNVYAVQFHPEKSRDVGLKILKNFGEMIRKC